MREHNTWPRRHPGRTIKIGLTKLYEMPKTLFTRCITGENIPNEWRTLHTISIFKKAENKIPKTMEEYLQLVPRISISRIFEDI